nr:MAG TPA: hypothetical protein [Caudoviricetes sp.]
MEILASRIKEAYLVLIALIIKYGCFCFVD